MRIHVITRMFLITALALALVGFIGPSVDAGSAGAMSAPVDTPDMRAHPPGHVVTLVTGDRVQVFGTGRRARVP